MVRSKAFDCIVLGAGAAGLAAARGLSLRFPDARIAVIEQGTFPRTYNSRFLGPSFLRRYPFLQRVPLLQPFLVSTALGRYSSPGLFRDYSSIREPGLEGDRGLQYVSGQGVGGGTLLCDMKAVRPTQSDCQRWGPGWSWEELFPFFHETVRCAGDPPEVLVPREGGESSPRPLSIVRRAERSVVDAGLNVRFYEACEAAGIPPSASFNHGTADGFSFYESLVTKGLHERALLHPEVSMSIAENTVNVDEKPNGIILFLNMKAQRVLMDPGSHRAKYVECSCVNSKSAQVFKGKHIVVTLGTLESPAFLLRSGIGAKGHVADIPAVGENLIASTSISTGFLMRADPSTNAMMPKSLNWRYARYLYRQWKEYKESGAGIFSTLAEGGVFLPSDPQVTQNPDLSIDFYRQPMVLPGEASRARSLTRLLSPLGLSFVCTHHYPRSRGHVRLKASSTDTCSPSVSAKEQHEKKYPMPSRRERKENNDLEVKFRIYSDEENYDIHRMDNGLEWISRLTSPTLPSVYYFDEHQRPVSPFYHLGLRMHQPNKSLTTEEEVHEYLKQHSVVSCGSLYGTCALGSVVQTVDLSVKGMEGLYVADASVIPTPTVASSWLLSAAIGARISTFF